MCLGQYCDITSLFVPSSASVWTFLSVYMVAVTAGADRHAGCCMQAPGRHLIVCLSVLYWLESGHNITLTCLYVPVNPCIALLVIMTVVNS
jgi:hypothetical protein